MRNTRQTETKAETRALGAITLVCYTATVAALFAASYGLMGLGLSAAGRNIAAALSASGM